MGHKPAIKLDVAIQMVAVVIQTDTDHLGQFIDDAAEDVWQKVFLPEGKRRDDGTDVVSVDGLEGLSDESTYQVGDVIGIESPDLIPTLTDFLDEAIDPIRAGPEPSHVSEVEVEVADLSAVPVLRFLDEPDLVDQAAGGGARQRGPRHLYTAERPLQRLQQRHEIPDCENVIFNEQPQRVDAVDPVVNRLGQQIST